MASPQSSRGAWVTVLEGDTVQPPPRVAGAPFRPGGGVRAVVQGTESAIRFDEPLLSKHVLFLGSIGSGKTNAMQQLFDALRENGTADDVYVVFDTKGDFLEAFYRDGDSVLTNDPAQSQGRVTWNIFNDLRESGPARVDEGFEIASTIFGDELSRAGENFFFAAAARDVFAAVLEAMARRDGPKSNQELRAQLEASQVELWHLINEHPDLAGARHYLGGQGNTSRAVLAFLQQAVRACFSGSFRGPGEFSVRDFVRDKGGHALFVEYDIASGSLLLPIYSVLLDLAIKEALGRARSAGSVYFIMDEFALLPQLLHISDGINFGRSLGLKFVVGSQNVAQVHHAYGPEIGRSVLSGFGTVFAFRLMDGPSRDFVRQRFGTNRKQVTTEYAVRAKGLQQDVVEGHVIEDWDLSALTVGTSIASLPEGPPFFFRFRERK